MTTSQFFASLMLMLVLLNPFLLVVYLLDVVRELDSTTFVKVLIRGGIISIVVFVGFAWLGDMIFTDLLQVRFSAFVLFGGIVFLIIGLRFVFVGPDAIRSMRGSPDHLAGSIAMPFMIGPATINASVLAGSRLPLPWAALAIGVAVLTTVVGVYGLKKLHDFVNRRNTRLVERYVDLLGRIASLVIGAFALEMIFTGVEGWIASMRAKGVLPPLSNLPDLAPWPPLLPFLT